MTPQQFMQLYERRTNAHDLDGTLALIADDAIYLFSDGSSYVGKAAIAEILKHNFAAIRDETYSLHEHHWLVMADDAAACAYVFRWVGEIDGKPASGDGRGTSVIKRAGERWLVVHEHLSKGGLV
jgi:ketosteroid isomerase-like protein